MNPLLIKFSKTFLNIFGTNNKIDHVTRKKNSAAHKNLGKNDRPIKLSDTNTQDTDGGSMHIVGANGPLLNTQLTEVQIDSTSFCCSQKRPNSLSLSLSLSLYIYIYISIYLYNKSKQVFFTQWFDFVSNTISKVPAVAYTNCMVVILHGCHSRKTKVVAVSFSGIFFAI